MAVRASIPSRSRQRKSCASPPRVLQAVTLKDTIHGEKSDGLQNPAHGRVLRLAARIQDPVRWPFGSPRVSSRRGGPHQCGRLPRAPAGQRPQYRSPGVRELLDAVAKSRVPCMSIMNMPPLPYVRRIPGLNHDLLKPAYTDPTVWDSFDPETLTLCSPDPQAIRPPDEKVNVLQVTLPTNFKVARLKDEKSTAILRQLEKDIEAVRFDVPEGKIELPVKLRVYDSIFVPLAKWAMLLAGNYRTVTKDGMRTAQEAVHTDIETSRSVYNFVNDLCVKLGANPDDLVPFDKYAAAAQSLTRPASAARALNNGLPNIERADKLVQLIAKQKGLSHPVIDAGVALVDARLEANRKKAAAA